MDAIPYPNVGVTLNGVKIPAAVFGINNSVYLKLRDLAVVLDVRATFEGGAVRLGSRWATNLTPSTDPLPSRSLPAVRHPDIKVYLDGTEISVAVYGIDGSTVLGLGDAARALGLYARWDGAASTAVLTTFSPSSVVYYADFPQVPDLGASLNLALEESMSEDGEYWSSATGSTKAYAKGSISVSVFTGSVLVCVTVSSR